MIHPAVRYLGNKQYEGLEDWSYFWSEGKKRYRINVPKGFICDLGSVPRAAQTAIGLIPAGDMTGPGYLHDFVYTHRGVLPAGCFQELDEVTGIWWNITDSWTRMQADWLLRDAMAQAGIPAMKRWPAWWAVRKAGGSHWGNKKE